MQMKNLTRVAIRREGFSNPGSTGYEVGGIGQLVGC